MKKAIVIFSLITASVIMVKCSPKAGKATTATTTTTAPAPPEPPVPPAAAAENTATPEQIASGKKLYDAKCGTCHKLYEPIKYTQASWKNILKAMLPKAKVNEADGNLITFYVMANAKQG